MTYFIAIILFCLVVTAIMTYFKLLLQILQGLYESSTGLLLQVLRWVILWAQRWAVALQAKLRQHLKSGYEPLSAEEDESVNPTYLEALEYGLQHTAIRNIALSGTYGSGKSTILKTFQRLHPEYKYLNISLAAFNKTKFENELLEVSILQQMFYHVKHSDIPDSRFKRIKKLSRNHLGLKVLMSFFWGVSLFYLIKRKDMVLPKSWSVYFAQQEDLLFIIALWTFMLGSLFILYTIFRIYNYSQFNKLNLSSGEIEFADQKEASILNKRLDEIVYFFDKTGFNVVILEDLDRVEENKLFDKLRELNILINNARQVGRRVVFIFALKDELFSEEEKTKFFDFIIPVIPVVNASNSGEKLLERIGGTDLKGQISEHLIAELSYYINDMRLLKNIFNEFMVYRNTLSRFQLNPERLLGMIVYKNKFSVDFNKLNKQEGTVYDFFKRKDFFVVMISAEMERQEKLLKARIEEIESEIAVNKHELRSIYIFKLIEMTGMDEIPTFRINNQSLNFRQFLEDDYFKLLVEYRQLSYQNGGTQILSFKDVEAELDPSQSARERENKLLSRLDDELEETKRERENILEQIFRASQYTFKQIIALPQMLALEDELLRHDLLVYLVRNGYLDEDYYDYTSHFYEGSLTARDKQFVLSVTNHRPLPFNYPIDKKLNVASKLRLRDFEQAETLNFSLLETLLENGAQFATQLGALLQQLSNGQKHTFAFIQEFVDQEKQTGKFIEGLVQAYPGFWKFLDSLSGYSTELKDRYLKLILAHADLSGIKALNIDRVLNGYISKKVHFRHLIDESAGLDKIKSILKALNVRFTNLSMSDEQDPFYRMVCENSLYALNPASISSVMNFTDFRQFQEKNLGRLLTTMPYHAVKTYGGETMNRYVEDEFKTFADQVLLRGKAAHSEPEEILIDLYNRPEDVIATEDKQKLVSIQKVALTQLSGVPQVLWTPLMERARVEPNWTNVFDYHQAIGESNKVLIDFLNRPKIAASLGKTKLAELLSGVTGTLQNQFYTDILFRAELSNSSFSKLLNSFDEVMDTVSTTGMNEIKLKYLIKSGKVAYSNKLLEELSRNTQRAYVILVETYQQDFMDQIDLDLLSGDVLGHILASRQFSEENRELVFRELEADKIRDSAVLKTEVFKTIRDLDEDFDAGITRAVLGAHVSEEARVKFLLRQFEQLDEEDFKSSLREIGGIYTYLANDEYNEMDVADTPLHQELLSKMKDFGYILEYHDPNDGVLKVRKAELD
ncbi:hypothetical protein [Pedobacter sp. D749]|uniref:YobI family P-loop NTPase n=1 Tax=Pedobacter sp. D749 TaxID=2856523 RepID=UPI001C585CDA|nr:hypothetical protein [Pedobacter sp. D749]QXU43477.1 hypothetical protein KYH19_07805 [Pedobacter sp. D749]